MAVMTQHADILVVDDEFRRAELIIQIDLPQAAADG